MKKGVWLFFIVIISSILFAGCSDEDMGTSSKTSQAFTPTNKSDIDLSAVTLKIGAAEGKNAQSIIKAAGLDDTPYKVEYNTMQGGNLVMEAMVADQLDLGTGSQIPPIFSSQANNGGNFKIIAVRKGPTLNQELLIGPDSTISSISELKGKKVAYAKSTTAQYFLFKMLQSAGLSWDDIDATAMTTSDGLSALLTGDIDALAGYGNAVRIGHQKGAKTLLSAKDILSGDFYWYATPAAIADPAKHAAIVDYLERFHEANEWARQNPKKWAQIYSAEINQKPEDFLQQFEEENQQVHVTVAPVDTATISSEQDIINTFGSLGLLKKEINSNELFDKSFNDAIEKFKKY